MCRFFFHHIAWGQSFLLHVRARGFVRDVKLNHQAAGLSNRISHIEWWRKLEHMELQSALMIPQNGKLSVSFIVWVGMYCITWQLWTALKIVLLCMKLQKVEQLPDLPTITSRDEMLVKRRRNLELAWNSSPYYIEKTKAKCGKFSATKAFWICKLQLLT